MRRLTTICTLTLSLAALALPAAARELPAVYGEGVAGQDTVLISHILDHPEQYNGKTIQVQGVAVAVCEHRGCWVELASDREGQTLRIKVEDGVIVFPREIVGHRLTARGTFRVHKLDLETTRKICSRDAARKGEKFDPASVQECMKVYQLHATGAALAD